MTGPRLTGCLRVVVPPGNPLIEARDQVLQEGNQTEMTCTAMSSKPAAAIRWMKGEKELPGGSEFRLAGVKMFPQNSSQKFPFN